MFSATRENYMQTSLEALLHHRHEGGEVYSVITPSVESDYPTPEFVKSRSHHPSSTESSKTEARRSRYDSATSSDEEQAAESREHGPITVNGADIGDLPAEYTVHGLVQNELPVIGTYVDKRILPGFRYQVRILGASKTEYMFNGEVMRLLSIGRGYGKRITFAGEMLNNNNNYFYSDTNPTGYALRLVALEPEDSFTVASIDHDGVVGEVKVVEVYDEEEIDCYVDEVKSIVKKVCVKLSVSVDYASDHGLMPLYSSQRLRITGTAIITKKKGSCKAQTTFIEDVELPHHGLVTLEA